MGSEMCIRDSYSFDASDGVTIDRKEQVITSDLSRVIKSDADRRVGHAATIPV